MPRKRTYLDSGVLMAFACAESQLFAKAYAIVNDPSRDFIISDITKLEVLPYPTFGQKSEEVELYEKFFSGVAESIRTTSEKIADAFLLACRLGLGPCDAIHLQTAIDAGVSEFITTEKQTKPFFRLIHPTLTVMSIN